MGEASGMFPIDSGICDFDQKMLAQFDELVADRGFGWKLKDILPKVLPAGAAAGTLTAEGAKLLDPDGELGAGVPMCPPEGDAGTGMVATNSVKVRTGNISAGTSIFSMVVTEHALNKVHDEIDMVTTPDGYPVAMVHCNNCTSDLNAWVNLFEEFAGKFGMKPDKNELYGALYREALTADRLWRPHGLQLFLRRAGDRVKRRKTHVCPHTRCSFQLGEFHEKPLVQRHGGIEDRQ